MTGGELGRLGDKQMRELRLIHVTWRTHRTLAVGMALGKLLLVVLKFAGNFEAGYLSGIRDFLYLRLWKFGSMTCIETTIT
jgi:hypothetical protein